MATWGWGGDATRFGPVDNLDVWPTRLFDGTEEIIDWIKYVDEEKGFYIVNLTENGAVPPPIRPPGGPSPVWLIRDDDIVTEKRYAKVGLKVFRGEQS